MDQKRGYLTIATGAQKYVDMAVALAMSVKLNSPGIPMAVVSDSKDPLLATCFDLVIPANPSYPKGILHKLYMYDYSPFEETIFIDGDSMVVRDISMMFEWFKDANVTAIGKLVEEPRKIFGLDFEVLKERTGISYIGAINGGIYYFKKNAKAKQVYDHAKLLSENYDEIGFGRLRGGYNEEGLMAVSMAKFNELPYDDKGMGMRTPIDQSGQFRMDVLKRQCAFLKHGQLVTPAVMHFGGDCTQTFFYRRELCKLKWAVPGTIPRLVISPLVNLFFNIPYAVFVFGYRLGKTVLKGKKFKVFPLLPMYRFE